VNTPFGGTLQRFIEPKRVQVMAYEGDCLVETAKSGILRVGSHSRYGFGELRVKPVEPRSDQCLKSEGKTKIAG
jgi:hypothetical protein